MLETNEKISEAHIAIKEMRLLKEKMKPFADKKLDAELAQKVKEIDSTLNVIENELYQTKNRSNQDPLNYPIKLTNKLGNVNSLVGYGDFKPTEQSIQVRDELVAKIDMQLAQYYKIRDEEIPMLNKLIREKSIDVISINVKKD